MKRISYNLFLLPLLILSFCGTFVNSASLADNDWQKSTLSVEGIDSVKFNGALKYITDSVPGIRSMVIIHNGKLVVEKYYHIYNIDTTYLLFSATKSILGILTGIAIQDNLIKDGIKGKVLDYFPEINIQNLTDDKKKITIEDLLTMRSGLKWNESNDNFYDDPNSMQYILNKPMDTIPSVKWNYNSGSPHVLSAIITKVSKMSTLQFAQEKLFLPLGITVVNWEMDSKGVFFGGYGLWMKPKDLAKIGYLCLNNGLWHGTRIVSENWIKKSTEPITSTYWANDGKYGYLWWVNDFGGYSARGIYGQIMYVIPNKNLVIVFTSAMEPSKAGLTLNHIVKDFILSSIKK